MRLRLRTTAGKDRSHHAVALYAMVVDGGFQKVRPSPDAEDIVMDLGGGRSVIGGTLNAWTHREDVWQIHGELKQFIQTASETVEIFADGQRVGDTQLGPHTDRPPFPTGPTAGMAEHTLFLDGAGVDPTGTFIYLVDGEFISRDDPGEICLRVGDGWYVMVGHIAGGTDTHRFAGRLERAVTGGANLGVRLDGNQTTWGGAVSRTGGSGRSPPVEDDSGGNGGQNGNGTNGGGQDGESVRGVVLGVVVGAAVWYAIRGGG